MELAMVLGDGLKTGKFWTDAWSLVEGCTPVSPGCKNCWLAGMYKRNLPNLQADVAGEYTTPSGEKTYRFHGNVICHEDRLDKPLRARKPRVYAIWSDLFHEGVTAKLLDGAFSTMQKARHHHFIIITKRPEVAVRYLDEDSAFEDADWPLPNVSIMVTMEDQQRANERVPHAMKLAAAGWRVGVLCEPLIGPVNLCLDIWPTLPVWIITGGESGHGARPVHPDWVRSLRDQAQAAGVPFLFKQWGEWAPYDGAYFDVDDDSEQTKFLHMHWDGEKYEDVGYPGWSDFIDYWAAEDCTVRVGKKHASRFLDGKEWLELPAT